MPTRARLKLSVVLLVAALAAASFLTPAARAHGSTRVPASRTYACRFEAPDNPMCARARAANEQALFDWMEVNIANANGRHRELIPDGRLCSAGRDKYAAFDDPGDWPLTHLRPSSAGRYEIVFTNTAPHATAYYRFLLTQPGFDARSDMLTWNDLALVHDSGPLPPAAENRFSFGLPDRTQPAILYVIWQRSDSPEAFYACSDVVIGDGTTPPSSTTTSTTTTTPPGSGNPSSPIDGIDPTATITSDWGTGFCVDIQVRNTTTSPLAWEVHYRPAGTITSLWDAVGNAGGASTIFVGRDWNRLVAGGASIRFGMCASRT
jgi:chitin-binding protein